MPGGRGGVMLVFWEEALVFLAVPKTGTTALQGALAPRASVVFRNPSALKHVTATTYKGHVEPLLARFGNQSFETVAVVREPIDWLGSWYRYRLRYDLVGDARSTRGMGFSHFVTEFSTPAPATFAAVGSQARFLGDQDGKVGVTHLFRYERMDALVAFLEDRLRTNISLPRLNVSPTARLDLSTGTEALLRRVHAAEFALWNQAPG